MAAFLLPALVFLGVFLYYPIEETFRLSLMRSSGLGDETFIGVQNYARLFGDTEFHAALWHAFVWAFWSIVIQIPLAFGVAFALTYYKNRLTGPLRAIYYLANILPTTITSMLGLFIFAPTNGVIERAADSTLNVLAPGQGSQICPTLSWPHWGQFFAKGGIHAVSLALTNSRQVGVLGRAVCGLQSIDFFGDKSIAFWTVFVVATWAYTGFPIIFLMARMEQISKDIRDAAELDGVTGWSYAWYIVRPMVSYPLRILAVLCTVGSLKLFDLPYLLTKGGPGDETVTLGIMLYNRGFVDSQYGKAAAVGVVIFLLSLVFTVLQFSARTSKGDADEG